MKSKFQSPLRSTIIYFCTVDQKKQTQILYIVRKVIYLHLKQRNSLSQLVNNGPSVVSQSRLEVKCPLRAHSHELLYPVELITEGPLSCSSKHTFNALKLKVRTHTQLGWHGEAISHGLFLALNI